MNTFFQKFRFPLAIAFLVALPFTWRFSSYLPITEGWTSAQKFWFPLPLVNLAFHEAGHVIFGILGIRWITVAGGTLMQLLIPLACLISFARQDRWPGVGFCLFWIGTNFLDISLYAADAKIQVLILTTGMSGSEGGGHDWAYLLGSVGLTDHCIGIGQFIFWMGAFLMAFTVSWGFQSLWQKWTT